MPDSIAVMIHNREETLGGVVPEGWVLSLAVLILAHDRGDPRFGDFGVVGTELGVSYFRSCADSWGALLIGMCLWVDMWGSGYK